MKREPLIFYRLRCGDKIYGPWHAGQVDAFSAGLPHKVTFKDGNRIHLGPLAWIEKGQRRYAKSRTVPLGRA